MSLIDNNYVKTNFTNWDDFLENETEEDEDILTAQRELAETEFLEHITATESTITDIQKRHLLNIVKKNLFMVLHADTEFDRRPQLLKDYDKSIEYLKSGITNTTFNEDEDKYHISVNAKERKFKKWFY